MCLKRLFPRTESLIGMVLVLAGCSTAPTVDAAAEKAAIAGCAGGAVVRLRSKK